MVDLKDVFHSSSPLMQMNGEDNWSHYGDHERLDPLKKLKEQPRNNPIDPKNLKTKAGGQ